MIGNVGEGSNDTRPELAGCVFWNGLVGEDRCWCRVAAPGAEQEGGLEQGRRNWKNHFRKEMRN